MKNTKQRSKKEGKKDTKNLSIFPSFHLSFNRGYTLLFAMIVASIVLALGVSLLTISRKEFILSSSATQSTNAFYAADSGIGCAEYWDSGNEFATDTPPLSITCSYADANNQSHIVATSTGGVTYPNETSDPTYTFTFYTPFSTDGTNNKSCAAVTVDKYYVSYPGSLTVIWPTTTITSRGYNIGWNSGPGDCSTPSPKKLERAIQVTY